MNRSYKNIHSIGLALFLLLNIAFWTHSRPHQAQWLNVPPLPSGTQALSVTLGDEQFAYRFYGITLQNLGDSGGRYTALKDYNYERLGQWFLFMNELDPRSSYAPLLASFYFGAVQDVEKLDPIIDYLIVVGQSDYEDHWRWLTNAIWLARYRQENLEKAQSIAEILAQVSEGREDVPIWAKQMSNVMLIQSGEKQAALELMVGILREQGDTMDPTEIVFIKNHICNNILDKEAAKTFPLCKTYDEMFDQN